jgi:AraC-like DNA-binding protein
MDLKYSLLNVLILLGAIQGFMLCFIIFQKRKNNPLATKFFVLFLFSLAYLNFIYACLDLDLFKYYRPLHVFPLPYKWLIGIGLYFYIRYLFKPNEDKTYYLKEWYVFSPAILYFLLRSYWFGISIKENSYRITAEVVESGFFTYHEFAYLVFNLGIGYLSLRRLLDFKNHNTQKQPITSLNQVLVFVKVFIGINMLHLCIYSTDLIIHSGVESWPFYYAMLILNSIYIYWIGYIGFSKTKLLFPIFKIKEKSQDQEYDPLLQKIETRIIIPEIFTNGEFSLHDAAQVLEINPKQLSTYLNTVQGQNFSEFLNHHRTEKVKTLLLSEDSKKYTLFSLAQQSGFKTKSSFNATFKRLTGMTPSAYQKQFKV